MANMYDQYAEYPFDSTFMTGQQRNNNLPLSKSRFLGIGSHISRFEPREFA